MLRLAAVAAILFCAGQALAAPSILVDAGSGRVLQSEQAFERWNPASLTKLMTAYVAFSEIETGNLTLMSPVRITANAANNPPARMGYRIGTILTLDNALTIMIVKSANDVAVAVGEAVAGSEADFVARMNAEAARLGMTDTHFANPNGLSDASQYTTARDLGILASAIRRRFPSHAHYFSTEAIRYGETVSATYNLLLGRFDGADGMKTGFVCASGFNLVASATRDGRTLIAVVLGELNQEVRAEKAAKLLDEGFASIANAQAHPLIQDLARPADAGTEVANMRPVVCTEEAEAGRWDGRQVEGYMTFDTASIRPLDRAPVAVPVRTGGAVGSSRTATMLLGRTVATIPVPATRPEHVSLSEPAGEADTGLRPTLDAPIPVARPGT